MATPTRKRKYEEVRWSLSRSSLAVCCAGVSAFRFPTVGVLGLIAITTTHCTVHHHARTRALAVAMPIWCVSVGTCNVSVSRYVNGTDTVGRSVGPSMHVVPVDHASVGLAQARPNYVHFLVLIQRCVADIV